MMGLGAWYLCFAWLPVWVDAYSMEEIGKFHDHFSRRVWLQTVECKLDEWIDPDDEGGELHKAWRYRLPQEGKSHE